MKFETWFPVLGGMVLGLAVGGMEARGALVNHFQPPQVIRVEVPPQAAPEKQQPLALDSVVKLYGPGGGVVREYTGTLTGIEQVQGGLRFKLSNGRTVILGGSFSVEEIPHQE